MNIMITFLAGLLSGAIGAMGLGGGGVLLIYLTVFEGVPQLKAQGINLIFFIPSGIIAVIIYALRKKIKWKTVLISAAFGLLGAFGGTFLAKIISADMLSKVFAVCLIVYGVFTFFKKDNKKAKQ